MPAVVHFQRDSAYQRLLDLILSGAVQAGAPLSERGLVEQLGIGRTPIREAIRTLAQEGLLEIHHARGTFVRQITLEQLHELYEVRQLLEGHAAHLAAQRGPTPQLSACGPFLEKAKSAQPPVDWDDVYETGVEFHIEVFRAAKNELLLETYMPIRHRFRLALRLGRYYDQEWIRRGMDDHLDILRAIEARDSLLAQRLMSDHVSRSYESKRRLLAGLRDTARLTAASVKLPPINSSTVRSGQS